MVSFKTLVLSASVLALIGCDSSMLDNAMQKKVREKLKDPDSAKWGEQLVYKNRACLQVNSKNSYGGYTGNQTAWLEDIGYPSNNWYLNKIDSKSCYEHVLRELSERDDVEKDFETQLIETLKTKGIVTSSIDITLINRDDPSTNSCLKIANEARTAFGIASDNEGDERVEWESKAIAGLKTISTSDCRK